MTFSLALDFLPSFLVDWLLYPVHPMAYFHFPDSSSSKSTIHPSIHPSMGTYVRIQAETKTAIDAVKDQRKEKEKCR